MANDHHAIYGHSVSLGCVPSYIRLYMCHFQTTFHPCNQCKMQSFSVIIGNPVILWNHIRMYLNVQGTVYPPTSYITWPSAKQLEHKLQNHLIMYAQLSHFPLATSRAFPTVHISSYTHSTVHPGLAVIALGDSPFDDSATLRMLDRCTNVRIQLLRVRKETQNGDKKPTNIVAYDNKCLLSHILKH